MLAFASSAQAALPFKPPLPCGINTVTASQFRPWASSIWEVERWERGRPEPAVLRALHRKLRCAAGPGHRKAMLERWRAERRVYFRHRQAKLAALNINRVWGPALWAPDYSTPPGSQLPPYVIAALAEETGDVLGVDVPGWTMAQMTQGESIRRPASAAVDAGGSVGYGLHAITRPFNDDLLARFGWSYEPDMWNPVRNTVIMALIYGRQGLAAWYGDGHLTCRDCHYRGRFDLSLVLGGKSLAQAIR
ncbi:MAG TPA: hypothetical protein VI039_12970 [Solirubrobacterales bacterium]